MRWGGNKLEMLPYWTSNRVMGREEMATEVGKDFSWQDMPHYRSEETG
jgi:hypothetical protein